MSAPTTSGLSVELLLRVIDVKYGCFTLLYFLLRFFSCPFAHNIFAKQLAANNLYVMSILHLE